MELSDIQFSFNRALSLTFDKKKLFVVATILLLCGLMITFFRGVSLHTGQWVRLSLTFIPVFLCAGVLLSTGVLLIRIYHNEIKKRNTSYRNIVSHSWDIILGTAYLSVPIVLSYLLLWMLLGVFFLLNEIPVFGQFLGMILAFAPFLLNLGTLALCVLSVALLFFVTPAVALKGLNRIQLSQLIAKRFYQDVFFNLLFAGIALLPLIILFGLLSLTAAMTGAICYTCDHPIYNTLQWFFMMTPFMILLSPAVVFFFNFAAESHVLLQRQQLHG